MMWRRPSDLAHNSDITRLDEINDKVVRRVEKYKNSIALLENKKLHFYT